MEQQATNVTLAIIYIWFFQLVWIFIDPRNTSFSFWLVCSFLFCFKKGVKEGIENNILRVHNSIKNFLLCFFTSIIRHFAIPLCFLYAVFVEVRRINKNK